MTASDQTTDLSQNTDKAANAALSSMTGFARLDGAHGDTQWSWEIKSVNGRGLEARFRLPQGYEHIEPALRKALSGLIARGSVNVALSLRGADRGQGYVVNQNMLDQVIEIMAAMEGRLDFDKPRAENILNIRGVLEPADSEPDASERAALSAALTASFSDAVKALKAQRAGEGAAMAAALAGQLNEIDALTKAARADADATPQAIKARLSQQLSDLLQGEALSEDRLAQEAAVLAVKADIREELDRLGAHVEAARALMAGGGAVGRKLDFLTQEFNREANTLCAKAAGMSLKRIGLDLKSVIDQMREQVQNIE